MLNSTFNYSFTSVESLTVFIPIVLCIIVILFDIIIIMVLFRYAKLTKHSKRIHSRRVGILHSINTYIHLIGILSTLLMMSIRTLYGDLNRGKINESSITWDCYFIAYLMVVFAAGVYGSFFLQALYRFCRIILPHRLNFQSLYFHMQLILTHWLIIIVMILPIIVRITYIPYDYFCFNPFDDRLTATYISVVTVVIPVIGIFIIYIRILVYMKNHLQTRKQMKRIRRDVLIVRRVLLLVIIILQTSTTGIILWILTMFDKRLHKLFYRLLRFSTTLCMIICSIALLILSPQLKQAFHSNKTKQAKMTSVTRKQISSSATDDVIHPEDRSFF